MSAANNGGPAFPCPEAGENEFGNPSVYTGLTMRDYFAAQALKGILPSQKLFSELLDKKYPQGGPNLDAFLAAMAYRYADAMILARES